MDPLDILITYTHKYNVLYCDLTNLKFLRNLFLLKFKKKILKIKFEVRIDKGIL